MDSQNKAKLDKIQYSDLTGDNWAAYNDLLKELPGQQLQTFDVYEAKPIVQRQLDGKNSHHTRTSILIGIELLSSTPIKTTKVPVAQAIMWNQQIESPHARGTKGEIYLLKK